MGIVVLPFFLMAVGAILAIVDVATMGKSTSAMGRGAIVDRGLNVKRANDPTGSYGSGTL